MNSIEAAHAITTLFRDLNADMSLSRPQALFKPMQIQESHEIRFPKNACKTQARECSITLQRRMLIAKSLLIRQSPFPATAIVPLPLLKILSNPT